MASVEKSEGEVEKPNALQGPPQLVAPPIRLAKPEPASLVDDDSNRRSAVFWKKLGPPQLVKSSRFDRDSAGPLSTPNRPVASVERPRKYLSLTVNRVRRSWNTIHLNFATAGREPLRRLDIGGRAVKYRRFVAGVGQRGIAHLSGRTRILEVKLWQSLKGGIVAALTIIATHANNLSATTRRGYKKLEARSQAYLAARAPKAEADSIGIEISGSTQEALPVALPAAESAVMAAPPLAAPAPVPAQLQTQKSGYPRSNARLRTSFAMAGILAVLVLGLVSAVQHYATEALPSHVLRDNPSPAPMPATTHADTNAVSQKSNPKAKAVRPSQAAAIDSSKRASETRAVKPKRHSNEDDDYVARDTFVSYGNRPNSSH